MRRRILNASLGVLGVAAIAVSAGTAASADNGIWIQSRTGAQMHPRDFLHNGKTIPDPSKNPGKYYLTGTDYTGAFVVSYTTTNDVFDVVLQKRPIGRARAGAANFLAKALGLPSSDLCNIKSWVTTDDHTSPRFAGGNLGFSGCPGATRLPGDR